MDLKSILSRDTVALNLKGRSKEELIEELLQVAMRSGKIGDINAARKAVLERERRMSTGMKHGIAIPHGKTETVKELVACIGVSEQAIDFDALDREPCRIFIMTLSPADKTGPHLQFLAEVSLLFRSAEKRAAILAAKTPEEVLKVLTE
ncbi:MAG: PTS sugar transporter subunit IIA [Rectinemataceae bacterium]|jgi:PTS system nitrogen regulatory IIA component